jgi:hypothetical protein
MWTANRRIAFCSKGGVSFCQWCKTHHFLFPQL